MNFLILIATLILASQVHAQLITPGPSVLVFGKCPNACVPFSTDLFLECAGLKQLGCQLHPCLDASGGMTGNFACSLDKDSAKAARIEVRPDQKLIFDTLRVDTKFSFSVALQATKLPVDFYLLADATSSMANAISTVQKEFSKIISFFQKDPLVTDPHFGVGMYRDESELDGGFKNIRKMSSDAAAAQKAVDSLKAEGGDDVNEANLVALHNMATSINWRPRSRKIVVYFGDVSGHEPTCGKFGKLTRQSVIKELEKKGITVVGVSISTFFPGALDSKVENVYKCPTSTPAGTGQATAITTATGGGAVLQATSSNIVDKIVMKIKSLSATFEVDTSECAGKLISTYVPKMPITLAPGAKQLVKQTVSVPTSICKTKGTSPSFTCNIKYTESGAFLPPTQITAKKIIGCPK